MPAVTAKVWMFRCGWLVLYVSARQMKLLEDDFSHDDANDEDEQGHVEIVDGEGVGVGVHGGHAEPGGSCIAGAVRAAPATSPAGGQSRLPQSFLLKNGFLF